MVQMVKKCNSDSINRTISDQGRPWLGAVFVFAPSFCFRSGANRKTISTHRFKGENNMDRTASKDLHPES